MIVVLDGIEGRNPAKGYHCVKIDDDRTVQKHVECERSNWVVLSL